MTSVHGACVRHCMQLPTTSSVQICRSLPSKMAAARNYVICDVTCNPSIERSNKGPTFAICTLCSMHISVSGGGVHQIKRHCASKRHSNCVVELSCQPMITEVARNHPDTKTLSDQVCHAELCFTRFTELAICNC